ncbi:MAG TPA: MFS transporter [Chitinophagaceae bacterium]|nr:MFS transporter [Chitinophagaceae bacterium]
MSPRVHRIAVSVFFFIAGLTFSTWASRIPDIKEKLHLSEAGLGSVLFALPVGLMASLFLTGWLISRLGSRKVVVGGAIVYSGVLILLAVAATTFQLVLGLFLFGLFANFLNISMNTQAVGVEGIYGRSIMASFHGLWSLACFAGAGFGTFFVSAGISPVLHFALISIASGLLVFSSYRSTLPVDVHEKNKQPIFVLPDKHILVLGLIAFCCMVCEGAMADWSGVYFQKVVETPAAYTTLGYAAFTATMATGRFVGDWLVTKFGVKRMLQMSGTVIASGLLLAVFFPNLITATMGFLLVGFGVSSVVPIAYGLAGKSSTMSPSMALSAVSTIGFLGFLVGPPLIGFIAEASSLRFSFALIALLGLGTSILAGKVRQ